MGNPGHWVPVQGEGILRNTVTDQTMTLQEARDLRAAINEARFHALWERFNSPPPEEFLTSFWGTSLPPTIELMGRSWLRQAATPHADIN